MPEAKPWLQPLHEAKDVAFRVAGWIPPATPGMADDQNLALAAPDFRLSFVLSFRSSFQGGGVRSSTTAQCTFSRNSSISGSCLLISAPRVWAQERGCLAVGLSSPLPCPQTAKRSGCKGARNAREPATNPCSATGASGSHPPAPSLLTRRWAEPART